MDHASSSAGRLLERLSALYRNLMRRFANEAGLQLVHVEILHYLSVCNRYSNTTQGTSDYLGQTKGSISQSLSNLEENGLIKRSQDKLDKRVFRLTLTATGQALAQKLNQMLDLGASPDLDPKLNALLVSVQRRYGFRGFGVCKSCRYNESPGKNSFLCGLTKEKLSVSDVEKICKEHETPATG